MGSKRFVNPHLGDERRTVWDAIRWKWGAYADRPPLEDPPENFSYPAKPLPYQGKEPSAVWLGHSTYLIDSKGSTFLTDPIWSVCCAPIPIRSLYRLSNPPILLEDLPRIDAVLISHNHYDHLDKKTVRKISRLQPHILWIIPKGLSGWFHRQGISSFIELGWWEKTGYQQHEITAVPAQHFSGRTLWDKDKTLWNGYVIKFGDKTFYFVGDTGYNQHQFKEIGQKFSKIDLSLIPIGSYAPRAFMAPVHCNPSDAVQIHQDVNSSLSLGMHWKTFRLSEEPMQRPPYDLYLAMKEKNLPLHTFLPGELGVYLNW